MVDEIDAPVTGAKVDPDDLGGSFASIVLAIAGVLVSGGIVAAALLVWNAIATRTPDEIPEVSVA